jgi:pyruvate dehydrogenase E1 component alpha subunit
VLLYENVLLEHGVIDEETAKNIRQSARQKAIDARKQVLAAPLPDPATVEEGVYAD